MLSTHRKIVCAAAFFGLFAPAATTLAASHQWKINEIFSNADGTVQFIELKECCGGTAELGLNGKTITDDVNGSSYTIVGNLSGNTSGKTSRR